MRLAPVLILLCLLFACGGKPRLLTIQEQDAYMARQQCVQEANNVNPAFQGPWNPQWYDYYAMCMNSLGIPDYVINRLWP
ncbi:MAG: hypothetical protein HDQ93_01140 [Desulfovibrio sp.]|nr:hypothetical protein [Desulfovibrio sp.]